MIIIHSQNKSGNFYKLDKKIKGNYKLQYFTFTNMLYNVNNYNNKVYITINSTPYIVTLTNGYYDIDDTLWHKIDFQPLVGKAGPTVEDSQVKGGKGNKIGGKIIFINL